MSDYIRHTRFDGRLLCIGFGSIGQGVLPLILRHIDLDPRRIQIVTADDRGLDVARAHGIAHHIEAVTRDNYRTLIEPMLQPGDFLLNLSVEVSSIALMELCQERGALYLDTCIEPWPGGYTDASIPMADRTNYALRERARALGQRYPGGHTAVIAHGANPGLVSHFVKQALLNVAADCAIDAATPATREDWARLAHRLGVRAIHIAERDTQVSARAKEVGEFVNTWSIDGFVSEGCQPAELGWGSHERHLPADAEQHSSGSRCAVFLRRPGASVRVRSWTPLEGPYHGFLITHNEAISIADYYTVQDGAELVYRPTVHYAYHPCDAAVLSVHELAGRNFRQQSRSRLINEDIVSGWDELGVLLLGHPRTAYWYGSQLSCEEARRLCPHNNATSLQVTIPVLAGMVYAMEHRREGVVDADEIDFRRCLDICLPYLGPVIGAYSDWTPLRDRERLFSEDIDRDDPWQFKNVRVL